jgi:hypothetical protein
MHVKIIQKQLSNFADERDWDQFHNPKNLAMALSVEASELVEIFQWLTPEQAEEIMDSEVSKVEVTDINMPFFSMVWFMVKWAIASIPAIIILWLLFVMFGGLLAGLTHI